MQHNVWSCIIDVRVSHPSISKISESKYTIINKGLLSIRYHTFAKTWVLKYWILNIYFSSSFSALVTNKRIIIKSVSILNSQSEILEIISFDVYKRFIILQKVFKSTINDIQLRCLIKRTVHLIKRVQIKKCISSLRYHIHIHFFIFLT